MSDPTERADREPLPGRGAGGRFGRWELLRELGRGGNGVVHQARDTQLDRLVALKRLVARRPSARALERFQREAEVLARVRHPHLVALHEAAVLDGTPYLVMELVEGGSLQARLEREGPLDPDEAAGLVCALCRALGELHGREIVHRDLKPHNVLLDPQTGPKLTDLGAALLEDDERERLTHTGELVGTVAYMAPEQVDGKHGELDARTDVYGLGATLYALLTGVTPFAGSSGVQAIARIVGEPVRPPSALRAEVPRALDAIVLRCLEKDPARRWPTAAALGEALEGYLAGERSAPGVGPWALACVAAGLLAAGVWGLIALRGPRAAALADPAVAGADTASLASHDPAPGESERWPGWFRALPLAQRPPLPPGLHPDPDQPEAYVWEQDGSQLVWVPPSEGPFTMGVGVLGHEPDVNDAIAPGIVAATPRQVTISRGFFLGRTELTWGRYQAFCQATNRAAPDRRLQFRVQEGSRMVDTALVAGGEPHVAGDDEPVFRVTWQDARDYCRHYGLRLPSEAEWEWAARGPDPGRRYPWGDEEPRPGQPPFLLNRHDPGDGFPYCSPVGRFPWDKGWAGALDMGGNLNEWVQDWEAPYPEAPGVDPVTLERGASPHKVLRGGSWSYVITRGFTVFYRHSKLPGTREPTLGFRVLLELPSATRGR